MAIWLFRKARGAIREHQAKKAIPTTEDSHLVPETSLPQGQHRYNSDNGIELNSPRASHSVDRSKENAQARAEARQRNIQQWKLLIGLILPNFLAAVDVTIVAPAIPLISSDFSTFSSFPHDQHALITTRPPLRQLQLDRRRLYFDVHDFCPRLGPVRRGLRSSFHAPFPDVLDYDWQCFVRGCTVVGHAAYWKGTARLGCCWHHELVEDYPVG